MATASFETKRSVLRQRGIFLSLSWQTECASRLTIDHSNAIGLHISDTTADILSSTQFWRMCMYTVYMRTDGLFPLTTEAVDIAENVWEHLDGKSY
eukprot:scaffold306114_cov17-Prasinocladus_malaysianus.AAC.1